MLFISKEVNFKIFLLRWITLFLAQFLSPSLSSNSVPCSSPSLDPVSVPYPSLLACAPWVPSCPFPSPSVPRGLFSLSGLLMSASSSSLLISKPQQSIKRKILLSIYSQLCVVLYGEFGVWSLVGVQVCLTASSLNTIHTFCSGQVLVWSNKEVDLSVVYIVDLRLHEGIYFIEF